MGFLAGLGGGSAQAAPSAPQSMTPAVMGFPSVPEGSGMPAPQQQPKKHGGVGNFLGKLGDALLMASGRAPMYAPMMQARQDEERRQQVGQMLGNVLGRLDPSLRELVAADPSTGVEIFKLLHPQSKEVSEPNDVRVFNWYNNLPPEQQKAFRHLKRDTRPQIIGSSATGYGILDDGEEDDSGDVGGGEPTVSDQQGYDALPPGAFYRDGQGNRRQKAGGPTAGPSGGFL